MKLSIVSTLYMSAPYLREFISRLTVVAKEFAQDSYELLLVNDGSPDESLALAIEISQQNDLIKVVDLSRNFGHHKAMLAGLNLATGDYIFLIDSDLEEEPEWLRPFSQAIGVGGTDVVFGVQSLRRGGFIERVSGEFFYKAFRLLTGVSQPDNIVTARLMTARYVKALLLHQETEVNIGGLWASTGFVQKSVDVQKHSSSPTTYSLTKKVGHFVNAVTSFSSIPLVFTFYSGVAISASALAFISYLVFRYIFIDHPPDGYTSVIASIWLFSGLIILFLGIQGIYLAKVFSEVKRRPIAIVRDIFQGGRSTTGGAV